MMAAGESDWMLVAACRSHPQRRYWFGEFAAETAVALQVCRGCAVRVSCLRHAVEHEELLGIWGATTERERRRMIRAARRQVRGAPAA